MLEGRDLRVRDPRGPLALDDVSVIAHPGEVVVVVGPHGSGKSTLLRALAGLVRPQAGAIHLDGESLLPYPPHRRAGRGLIYSSGRGRILDGLSVRDNLAIGAWLRRDRRLAARTLERVLALFPALGARLHRPAASLAGGERQMLALGRALMSSPRALLLDEPLAGLDRGARGSVLQVVRTLRDDGIAILATERDLPGAAAMADRAYGLKGGRVVFSGSAAALRHATVFDEIYE